MENKDKLSWIFFDIGNVLMDETPWLNYYTELIYRTLSSAGFLQSRERYDGEIARILSEERGEISQLWHLFVPDEGKREALRLSIREENLWAYYELTGPLAGIPETLRDLAADFQLGIIANQQKGAHRWLEKNQLQPYFQVCALDCDLGVAKPDRRHFEWALKEAGCRPKEAMMIGDRLDYDIEPAKALGMSTIRLRACGDYRRREVRSESERPDVELYHAIEIAPAVRRLASLPATPLIPIN